MSKEYRSVGRRVPEHLAQFALRLMLAVGPERAARLIGISRGTLAAVIGGLPVAATTEARVLAARRHAERRAA